MDRDKREEIDDPDLHKLTDIIILANHIIKDLNFGNSGYKSKFDLSAEFLRRIKINADELEQCKEEVRSALEDEAEHLAVFSKE